jgi:prevent-host-death family protein
MEPIMKLSERIKPISYLKANAAEVIAKLAEHQQPMIITVNGEAKAVLQDIDSYEEMQEAIALMKIIQMGQKEIREGKVLPLDEAFKRIRDGSLD